MRANVAVPLGAAALLGLLIFGRTGCDEKPNEFTTTKIMTQQQFAQVKAQAAQLSLQHLQAFEDGELLSAKAIDELQQTDKMFDALTLFAPDDFSILFGSGQVAFALDNFTKAEIRLARAAKVAPDIPDAGAIQLAAQASYYLSMARLYRDDLKGAKLAIEESLGRDPQNPNYLAQLASIYVQLRNFREAEELVKSALRIDPINAKAIALESLLSRQRSKLKK